MKIPPFPLSSDPGPSDSPVLLPLGAQLIYCQSRTLMTAGLPREEFVITWEMKGEMNESGMLAVLNSYVAGQELFQLHVEERDGQGVIERVAHESICLESLVEDDLQATLDRWSMRHIPAGKPSCSCRFFRLGAKRYLLGLSGGHELLDISTIEQFLCQIAEDYNRACRGEIPKRLPAPGFLQFSKWHASLLADGFLQTSELYWQGLLAGSEPVFKAPPAPEPSLHPKTLLRAAVLLEPSLTESITLLAHKHGCTVFEAYMAVFNILLKRISGRRSLLTAFVASLRRIPELRNIPGCLLNRMYLPVDMARDDSFLEVLHQIHTTMQEGKKHLLWPTWQGLDPKGEGYPGLFFHYVPPRQAEQPLFDGLKLYPYHDRLPRYWPMPMTLQVVANTNPPMVLCIGQAGFCTEEWLRDCAQQYRALLEEVSRIS